MKDKIVQAEIKTGIFSGYKTTAGPGDKIPFAKRPAQQVLAGMGVDSTEESKALALSLTSDQSVISTEENSDVTIISFDDSKSAQLTITGERITRLVKSAKTYVNTDIIPKGAIKKIFESTQSVSRDVEDQTGIYWQNLAVGICHAQEIDLLVVQNIEDGKALAGPRTGTIKVDAPAMVLLSAPALDFSGNGGLGNYLREDQRKDLIKGMYSNIFNAAIDKQCNTITLPAAGLGVFGGRPEHYHQALFELTIEYPQLNIIYNPGSHALSFRRSLDEFTTQNPQTKLRMTNKDVVFLADQLTRDGERTACHNPSDALVVLAKYDIGMHWKQSNKEGTSNTYVGEEHIGAMSTAPLNSFGLNPEAYNSCVEISFKKEMTFEAPNNEPSETAVKAIAVISEIVERFLENDETTLSAKDLNLMTKALRTPRSDDLDHIQIALKEQGLDLPIRLAKTKSALTRSKAIINCLGSKKVVANNDEDAAPVGEVRLTYFEKDNYDYFAVDKEGSIVCFVPFTACNGFYISSENTCKTGQTMRNALVGNLTQPPKILQVANKYLLDIRNDLNLFGVKTDTSVSDSQLHNDLLSLIVSTDNESLKGKATRFIQLLKYKTILEQVVNDPEIKSNLPDFGANFPQPVKTILSQSNAVAFNIETQAKYEDSFLRQQSAYVCTFKRGYQPDNFSMRLRTSLEARPQALRVKKPKVHLTKSQLLQIIEDKYQLKTKYEKIGDSYLIKLPGDIQILREAILESIKVLLSAGDFTGWKGTIDALYHNKRDNVFIEDKDLAIFIRDDLYGIDEVDELNCSHLLNEILITQDQLEALTKAPDCLPFEEERINTPAVFNDLIQIFVSSANFAYIEDANSKGFTEERATDFGEFIETDTADRFSRLFNKGKDSLVEAIEKAIDSKSSLEDTILTWLENQVLKDKPASLKTFSKETKARANAIFRQHFSTLYDLNEPSPHNDEYLMAIANDPKKPKVVGYRGALNVTLKDFCDAFTSKPWLKDAFKPSNHDISLPQTAQLNFDSDNIAVSSCNPNAAHNVNVMEQMKALMESNPESAAKLLLNTTAEKKKVLELLNQKQVDELKTHKNWSAVQNFAYSFITNVSEQRQFKDKFKTKATIHITLEMEQALYTAYSQFDDIDKLFVGVKRGVSIMSAVRGLCNGKVACGNFDTTITATGTYIFECDNPAVISIIKEVHRENKTSMVITPNMAGVFYKQINEIAPEVAEMVQAQTGSSTPVNAFNSGFGSSVSSRFDPPVLVQTGHFGHSSHPIPSSASASASASVQTDRFGQSIPSSASVQTDRSYNPIPSISQQTAPVVINITSEHKFIKTLKVLFPDLTILGVGEALPEGINEGSDDLIRVKFNAFKGYQISSSNPDNLNRIRESYQTSITRVLSFLEAKKFIHYAASRPESELKKPLSLDTATLEAALIEVGIFYSAVGQVDQTYQIICEDMPWETIKSVKKSVENPEVVPEPTQYTPEVLNEFFGAIQQGETVRAKELLSIHPSLLNAINPDYSSTPLVTAITFARRNPKLQKPLLDFAWELLAIPGVDLASKDQGGNTCLHKSIYYASELLKTEQDQTPFDDISAEICRRARIDGTVECLEKVQNFKNENAFIYDGNDRRIKKIIFKNTFWDLLTETRYFDFKPAMKFLAENSLVTDNDFEKMILNTVHPKTNKLPLEMAIERGNAPATQSLLAKGADVNVTFTNNKTPLELALRSGHAEVVKLLIQKGSDPNLPFADKKFPLELAIESGDLAVVKVLLENKANPNEYFTTEDTNGFINNPLNVALALGQNTQIKDAGSKSTIIIAEVLKHINKDDLGQYFYLLNDKYNKAQKTLTSSQLEFVQLDAQFQELQKNPLVHMQTEENAQQQLLKEHKETLANLAAEIARTEAKQLQMREHLDSLKSSETQLAAALDAQERNQAKLDKVALLNGSLAEKIQQVGLENNELEKLVNECEEQNIALGKKNEQTQLTIATTVEKRKQLKAELKTTREETKRIAKNVKVEQVLLKNENENLSQQQTITADIRAENEILKVEAGILTQKNQELEENKGQVMQSCQKLKEDIETLQKEEISLPQKKAELEAGLVAIEKDTRALAEGYQHQRQELTTAQLNHKDLQEALKKTTATNGELTLQNEGLAKENKSLEQNIERLTKEHEQSQSQQQEHQAKTEEALSSVKVAAEKLHQTSVASEEANKALQLEQLENDRLSKLLAEQKAETARFKEELEEQKTAQLTLKHETITCTQENTRVETDLSELVKVNRKHQSDKAKLVKEGTTLASEISSLEAEVKALKPINNELKRQKAEAMDSCFLINFFSQLSAGEILAYSLLTVVLLASVAGIALATAGTGLIGVAIASTVLTASITGASVSGAGLLTTSGYSLFSQRSKEPEEIRPEPKGNILGGFKLQVQQC